MFKRLAPFFPVRRLLYLGGAALLLGFFIKLTSELHEGEVTAFDQTVLAWVTAHRRPDINALALDLTALGSTSLLSLFTSISLFIYALRKRWEESLYLLLGMTAIPLGIGLTKHLNSRPRPPHEWRVIDVSGYSYPSGHSTAAAVFYLLLAILACRLFTEKRERGYILGMALFIIGTVCLSRIYLGAHYPSDVLSGFFLGSAWVLFLTAFFSRSQKDKGSRL